MRSLTLREFSRHKGVSPGAVRLHLLSGRIRGELVLMAGVKVWQIPASELRRYRPDPKRVEAAKKGKR